MPICKNCWNLSIDNGEYICSAVGTMPRNIAMANQPCNYYIYKLTLNDDRIANFILKTIYDKYGFNCMLSYKYIIEDKVNQLKPDKPEDEDVGKIAYNVPNKPRMKITTGKFLRRKLNLNKYFNDVDLQAIADNINNELFPEIKVKLLKGSDITNAYKNCFGVSSCMTNDDAYKTRLYEMNPDRFEMLTMQWKNDEARAILHKLDNNNKLLGCIYSSSSNLKTKMKKYAKE
jgi:hypothetical protein